MALDNSSNAFLTSVAQIANISTDELDQLPLADLAGAVEASFLSLATCVASIDITIAAAALFQSSGLRACLQFITSLSLSGDFSKSMVLDGICPPVTNTIETCVVDGLLPLATDFLGPAAVTCKPTLS